MVSSMKKTIKFLVALSIFIFLLTTAVFAYDIAVVDQNGNEYYHDSYIFFLPSHITPDNVTFSIPEGVAVTYSDLDGNEIPIENGKGVDASGYLSPYSTEPIYVLNAKIDGSFRYIMLRFATNLPSVYISFDGDVDSFLRYNLTNEETNATFYNKDGTIEFRDDSNMCELKVRGNATKSYKKKPFQIKLPMRANLYEMGSSKSWLLLANYDDQSLIRNNIMYRLGKELGMITSEFKSVDVFINGQYHGIYLLCEKIEIGKNRLEITDLEDKNDDLNSSYSYLATNVTSGSLIDSTNLSQYSYIPNIIDPDDITGGYLVELDNNYYESELCYFTTDYGNHYVIKSPEYASKQQVEYIATLFADMEEAIMASDGYNSKAKHYSEYIDMDSFASAYIMQEFGRNFDAGSSSMYFYKDQDKNGETSKIYKGPLWDCDNTLGNIHKNGASNTQGYWAANRSIWSGLTQKPDFMALVSRKFASVYDFIFDMIDYGGFIDSEVALIGDSIYMEQKIYGTNNYEKWPLYYDGTHYDKWQSSQVFNFCEVYSQGNNENDSTVIGYLCEHIEGRANWLVSAWNCDVQIRERRTEPLPEPPPEEVLPEEPPVVEPEPTPPTEPEPPIVDTDNSNKETNTESSTNTTTNTSTNTNTNTSQDTSTVAPTDTNTSVNDSSNLEDTTLTEKEKSIIAIIIEFIFSLLEGLFAIFE